MKRTLIIGVGNRYRQDDGVGLVVAERLRSRCSDEYEIIEQSGEGTALIEAWKGTQRVIIIDAVHSESECGAIIRRDARAQPLPQNLTNHSTHGFGVAEAIEMARALGRLPPRLTVYGIEGHHFELGQDLSPDVDRAADRVVEMILRELSITTSLPEFQLSRRNCCGC